MTTIPESIEVGKPRFNDVGLAKTARESGPLAAWQQAFQQFGSAAALHVSGDFAVGLRDASISGGKTFLAVDRFAIRTLCYRQVGNRLLFAERADELADGDTPIDPQAIFDYLYLHAIPSPRTILKGSMRSSSRASAYTVRDGSCARRSLRPSPSRPAGCCLI